MHRMESCFISKLIRFFFSQIKCLFLCLSIRQATGSKLDFWKVLRMVTEWWWEWKRGKKKQNSVRKVNWSEYLIWKVNGKDVVYQENVMGIWNVGLWKREALSESVKQKPAPGKCWWWGWWWEWVPCWQEGPKAFDQPVLKETPGAWNEILKHRPHPFMSLHWSALCIQRNSVKIWICQNSGNKSPMDSLSIILDMNRTHSNRAAIPKGCASPSDRRQLRYVKARKPCASNWQVDKTLTKNNYSRSSTWKGCLLLRRYQRKNRGRCCLCQGAKT